MSDLNLETRLGSDASALARNVRVTIGRLKRRFRREASLGGDLTSSQIAALGHLDRAGAMTITELATAEGMRPQSMGVIVVALETAGLVSRSADPNDGRRVVLSLTSDCKAKIDSGRLHQEDWLTRAIEKKLSPSERHDLARGIMLLKQITGSDDYLRG
jgi:DNA-binding MarR family transcriptional regulator